MNPDPLHCSLESLDGHLDELRRAPKDEGRLELIVRRPGKGTREVVEEAELDLVVGLVGDSWSKRPYKRSPDGGPHPEMQLNVMNATAALLVAGGDPGRRALAGDQLYVDLDLSGENLPAGTRLAVGDAVIEVTAEPHRGCVKFRKYFGVDAVRFVNSAAGRELNLRGINAKVVVPGTIRTGDRMAKLA